MRRLVLVLVLALASLFGAVAVPSAANAAQNNYFSMYYYNPSCICDQWENYTRSHTSTSDMTFTWGGSSQLTYARMDLRYVSNYRVFASRWTGRDYGRVTLASHWGATKFNVGLWIGTAPVGWYRGTLYY